ncbi:MAG: septum formation initiator family protein [Sphaerochaeta sp.]
MTRKIPLVFAFSLVFTFSLLMAVFGSGGFLHNQALKAEIERLTYEQSILSMQVESLERQRDEATSVDALKDAAFKYGYQSEGEQVYYFSHEEEEYSVQEGQPRVLEDGKQKLAFVGIPTIWVALASLVISSLITLCYAKMRSRYER